MNSNLAKIFGWAQFGLTTLGQVVSNGVPHDVTGWGMLFASLATAIGVHAASSTDGVK